MPKPVQAMTVVEMQERTLQLRMDEEKLWQQVAAMRAERAEIELEIFKRSQRLG